MDSDHVTLLQHTEVRCWLSRGKVLKVFFKLRDELKVFSLRTIIFTCPTTCMMTSFSHDWPIWVMFFSRLNILNLGLQGLSTTLFNVRDIIEAMIKKLELFSVCINKNNTRLSIIAWFFVCKLTQAYGQCQMWYSEAPEWVGCTTGLVIPFTPCLQSTYWYLNKRASLKLQQVVLWKCNLIRSHCQISG